MNPGDSDKQTSMILQSWDLVQHGRFQCDSGSQREIELGWGETNSWISIIWQCTSILIRPYLELSWLMVLLSTKMFHFTNSATWFEPQQNEPGISNQNLSIHQISKSASKFLFFFEIITSLWILWECHRMYSEHVPVRLSTPSITTLSTCLYLYNQLCVFFL